MHTVVETVSIKLNPLEGHKKTYATSIITMQRYFWNWLIAINDPIRKYNDELYWNAVEQIKATGIEDKQKINELAKKEIKGKQQKHLWAEKNKTKGMLDSFCLDLLTNEKYSKWKWVLSGQNIKVPEQYYDEWQANPPEWAKGKGRITIVLIGGKKEDKYTLPFAAEAFDSLPKTPLYPIHKDFVKAMAAVYGKTASGAVRKGQRGGYPQWKKMNYDLTGSIASQVQDDGQKQKIANIIDRKNDRVKFMSSLFGWIRYRDANKVIDRAMELGALVDTMRLCRNKDEWTINFDITYDHPDNVNPSKAVGIDVGVTNPFTLSTGKIYGIEEIKRIKKIDQRVKKLQREYSHKYHMAAKSQNLLTDTGAIKKGSRVKQSNTMLALQKEISGLKRDMTNMTKTFIKQTASDILNEHNVVVVEDLKINNMTAQVKSNDNEKRKGVSQKSGLNREILRRSWGVMFDTLNQISVRKYGYFCPVVPPQFTSQTCSNCGETSKMSRNSSDKTKFLCVFCGHDDHADIQAANNILHRWEDGGRKLEYPPVKEKKSKTVK